MKPSCATIPAVDTPGEACAARGSLTAAAVPQRRPGSQTRSNRQRRRDKTRARLGRTGSEAKKTGGFGGIGARRPLSNAWGWTLTRGDLAALRRAIGRDWEIGEPQRHEFLKLVWRTLQRSSADNPRLSISLCTTVVAMSAQDLRRREQAIRAILKRVKPL